MKRRCKACPHLKEVCEHGCVRKDCTSCDITVCVHRKIKKLCKTCEKENRTCPHGNVRKDCDACGPMVCPHGLQMTSNCQRCRQEEAEKTGERLCPHTASGKPSDCKLCFEESMGADCPHGIQRRICTECEPLEDPQEKRKRKREDREQRSRAWAERRKRAKFNRDMKCLSSSMLKAKSEIPQIALKAAKPEEWTMFDAEAEKGGQKGSELMPIIEKIVWLSDQIQESCMSPAWISQQEEWKEKCKKCEDPEEAMKLLEEFNTICIDLKKVNEQLERIAFAIPTAPPPHFSMGPVPGMPPPGIFPSMPFHQAMPFAAPIMPNFGMYPAIAMPCQPIGMPHPTYPWPVPHQAGLHWTGVGAAASKSAKSPNKKKAKSSDVNGESNCQAKVDRDASPGCNPAGEGGAEKT